MTKLDKLLPDLSTLTEEELRLLVKSVRKDRRITKKPAKVKKAAVRSKEKTKASLKELLSGMTPEEVKKLLGDG